MVWAVKSLILARLQKKGKPMTTTCETDLATIYADTGIDLSVLPAIATAKDIAPVLQTSVAALAQDRYRGRGVPFIKHGKRIRYLRADVARYLAQNRRQGTAACA
jgi:hypothetical protein